MRDYPASLTRGGMTGWHGEGAAMTASEGRTTFFVL